jgi:hypothetical protein
MPDIFRQLREEYGELQQLFEDVYAPAFAKQDWKGYVFARRSLGDGVQVELWYLAEHFLLAWNDWYGTRVRYLRYFGQPAERVPKAWEKFHTRCKGLAEQMLQDHTLDELLHRSWVVGPAMPALLESEKAAAPRDVYHLLVTNHRRVDLLLRASAWVDDTVERVEKSSPHRPIWPRCMDEAVQLNERSMQVWSELSRKVKEVCLWHLRQYSRANLLVSWLVAASHLDTVRPVSALLQVLHQEPTMHPSIEDFARRIELPDRERHTVQHVLHRVTEAIREFGYEGFCEDVTAGDFHASDDSPVGSREIDVIPSKIGGECRPTLLAVSRGNKKGAALSFEKVMQQVKTHLIDCTDRTRMVIFLCDLWSPDILADHREELRAHHRRGVRFLFLLVGSPERVVAPVAVDLAATP